MTFLELGDIAQEYSYLLKKAGVSTMIKLSIRNLENLCDTMLGVNEAKKVYKESQL